MFDYLVKDNNLGPVMEKHGLVLPEDLDFIKEQIAGPLDTNDDPDEKVLRSTSGQQLVSDLSIKATCSTVIEVIRSVQERLKRRIN